MTNDERFFAWLDGELSGSEAAEMEREVAADPALARLAEEHRALKDRLGGAFDPIAGAPVPERLEAALRRPDAEVIDFGAAKRGRDARRGWGSMPQWAAMAATLAVGIVVGTMVPLRSTAPVAVQGGRIYAAAALDQALDEQLASAPVNGDVRVGITFRDQAGAICRSFTESTASGLACRDRQGWQVRGLFAAPEGQSGAYRMAAGMDPALAALVDSSMAGEPFDAAQEKAAKQRGWR
jgi:hypothetical protein